MELVEKCKLPSDAARNICIDVLGLDKIAEIGNNDSQLAFDMGVIQDLTVKRQLEYAIPIIREEIKKWGEEICEEHHHFKRHNCPQCWQSLTEEAK